MLDRNGDYTTREGAQKLANAIELFWATRGKRVRVQVIPDRGFYNGGQQTFVVRSNMMGGRP